MEDKLNEAVELAEKYVLSAENKLVGETPIDEITIGDIVEISRKGVETANSIIEESIDDDELERLKGLDDKEGLSEEHSSIKAVLFGTRHKSCALHLFRNSLTK